MIARRNSLLSTVKQQPLYLLTASHFRGDYEGNGRYFFRTFTGLRQKSESS